MLLIPEVSKAFHAGTVSKTSVPFHESPLVGPILSHTNPVMYAVYMLKNNFNMSSHKNTHRQEIHFLHFLRLQFYVHFT